MVSVTKVKLLSHASILIEADGKKILTDPWFFGTAFNDGWELSPKPNTEDIKTEIRDVDIIWISHEHPDHLHFPTLKWIAEFMKVGVEIYYQKNNSNKVFDALKKLGYKNFVPMPHLKKIRITPNVELSCYSHRHLDSSLAVFVQNKFWLLNVNDTELNERDIQIIKSNFGSPTVLYNQFSIAGCDGIESHLKSDAASVLQKMLNHHKGLNAKMTIPFASFVRFARGDNKYMNGCANTALDAKDWFQKNHCQLVLQAIDGDYLEWNDISEAASNCLAVDERGTLFFSNQTESASDTFDYKTISRDEVQRAIEGRLGDWQKATNTIVWRLLKLESILFRVTDWNNEVWRVDFASKSISQVESTDSFDISIASQPLWQAFKMPFGIQTLGVSGRYRFAERFDDVPKSWKKIRIISSLYNSEVYLSIQSLFTLKMLGWVWSRRQGLLSQIFQQVERFKKV